MSYIFYIAVGVLSAVTAEHLGYEITDHQYWAITVPMIIIINSIWIALND